MLTIHLIRKIPSLRLAAIMLSLTIGMIVIAFTAALIQDQSHDTNPGTIAKESSLLMDEMKVDVRQKSWSDEWYAVHKAVPDHHDEVIQSF